MRVPDKLTGPHVNERTDRPGTYRVRWRLNGAAHTRDFADLTVATDFAADVRRAARTGARFDRRTGLPAASASGEVELSEWVRTYLADRWAALTPNSRRTDGWCLTYLVERSAKPLTTEQRRLLLNWLTGTGELPAELARWSHGVPALGDLDRPTLYRLEKAMRVGVGGTPLNPRLAARQVATMRRCLNEATRRGLVGTLDWPPLERVGRRKSDRAAQRPTSVPVMSVEDALALVSEMTSTYRAMTAIALFAGLRPAEVVALEGRDFDLDAERIHVRRAWNGSGGEWGDAAEDLGPTKTSIERYVPITDALRPYLGELVDGPLFRTATGGRPSQANWRRALRGAAERAGVTAPTPYACRHFFVSHLVRRVPIATAAAIAGHSPEVLVQHYLHDVEGEAPDLRGLFG